MNISEVMNSIKKSFNLAKREDKDKIFKKLTKLEKQANKLGQERLIEQLKYESAYFTREFEDAIPNGYTKYVELEELKQTLIKLKDSDVANLRLASLKDYINPIPEENTDEIEEASKYFDQFYILFTDYSHSLDSQKEIERDPIVFGSFKIKKSKQYSGIGLNKRLYYITDWEDEYCDLTLSKFITMTESALNKNIIKEGCYELHIK